MKTSRRRLSSLYRRWPDRRASVCRAAGFGELQVEEHPSRRGGALCVLGSAPGLQGAYGQPVQRVMSIPINGPDGG
jgi:hypothetical protein